MKNAKIALLISAMIFLISGGTGWAQDKGEAASMNSDRIAPTAPSFRLGDHNGAPALFVNDRPEFPMFLFEQEISERDAQAFQAAGVKLYSFIEKTSFLDLGWVGNRQQDFSTIDRVMKTFSDRVPAGYALPRLHLWAPKWWLDQHPEDAVGYAIAPGQSAINRDASMASFAWRTETGEMLRSMVRHLLDGPYKDRLMGLTLSAGMYGEWHNWNAEYLPDTSEPMRQAYIRYAEEKYNHNLDALRAAWKDSAVTFETIAIPEAEERRSADIGLFRNPNDSVRLVDYYEAYQRAVVDAINYFAGIVKEESQGRLLVSVLYGYTPDMGYMPQEIHHRAAAIAHRLTNVDLLTSPHTYWRRGPGEDGALRTYSDSLALHNKLFIDEADDRTHLAAPGTSFVLATNMDESLGIIQRAFGQAVTHATGMWYMDHSSGDWYNAPEIAAEFKRLKQWGDYSMHLPRGRCSEVAVISSNQSAFYLGGDKDVSANFYEGPVLGKPQGVGELSAAGAPFDRYLIEDLEEGRIPDRYKVYIFLDTFQLTDKQRAAINRLKEHNRTLVWNWAPGYAGDAAEGLSVPKMEQLTGFGFQERVSAGGGSLEPKTVVHEGFDSGTFDKSYFTAGYNQYGTITSDPEQVVTGPYSAHGQAPATSDWHEFLYSDSGKVKLEAGATYEVTFNAKSTAAAGQDGYYYFLARSPSGGVAQDVGVNQWLDDAGQSYTKSFTFTLKHFDDYKLIWGIHNGGGLSIDDITIKKVREASAPPLSFKLDPALFPNNDTIYGETVLDPVFQPDVSDAAVWGRAVRDGGPVIAVKDFADWRSVYVASTPIPASVLNRLYKEAGVHVYTDSYDNLEANQAWISIHASKAGVKTIRLPRATPVFNIMTNTLIGTHINEFQIEMKKGQTAIFVLGNPPVSGHVTEGFEGGSFAASHYTAGFHDQYGQISSNKNQVIDGNFSAYGEAKDSMDWYEFLYSHPERIRLEPGASYKVEFKAKTVIAPGQEGSFYFLARSATGGINQDVGVHHWTEAPGDSYSRSFTFTLNDYDDYRLIWGIHNGGALSIDDITITKL